MYKGTDTCAGCNISGEVKPRLSKTAICNDCANAIKLGNTVNILEEKERYINMGVRWYSFSFNNRDAGGAEVEKAFTNLFKTLHVGFQGCGSVDLTPRKAATASDSYNIRKDVYEALVQIVEALEIQQSNFKSEVDSYERKLLDEFRDKKNMVYNEGVEKGRELLFSLNNGEITLAEFEKKLKRF